MYNQNDFILYLKYDTSRLKQCRSPEVFSKELGFIIDKFQDNSNELQIPQSTYFTTLMSELESLGWTKLKDIDLSLHHIVTFATDDLGKCHDLEILLTPSFPNESPRLLTDLPKKFDFNWKSSCHLLDIYKAFEKDISLYTTFWREMEDIDNNTIVVDPSQPTCRDTYRRFLIDMKCSIYLSINPLSPRELGEWRITGPEQQAEKYISLFVNNINQWSLQFSIRENLERILSLTIPPPSQRQDITLNTQCVICYSYNLNINGKSYIPDKTCENEKCGRCFHSTCLIEWLQSNPTTKQSFDTLFGKCPYCSTPLYIHLSERNI
ncbi:hypothetical protein WA158_001635 [Blastocystis sp. Blastoise]